jgi:hypothetical protein
MNYAIIILGTVLVVMIVYMLFKSYFDGEQKLVTKTLLKNAVVPSVISKPNASNFSYGIWIYVNKWIAPGNAEDQTRIFTRKDEVGLYLENDASLKVRFADLAGKDVKATDSADNYTPITLTNNFPIQKWVHVGLVVDGNKFDGYIDGKMVKSIELNGMGIAPSLLEGKAANPLEFGTASAMANSLMIAEHKRRIYAMNPNGMWDLYMEGNGINGLTRGAGNVKVNLSILKDGVESSKFSLW